MVQDSPVVLSKTHVGHETDIHGNSQYRDILSADVRIASEEQEKYNRVNKGSFNFSLIFAGGNTPHYPKLKVTPLSMYINLN